MDSAKTVIVIRSLVPNGVAEQDGRLLPGDRLMYVNTTNLENSSLEDAVQALKGALLGNVQIGVAKPLPVRIIILSFCALCLKPVCMLKAGCDLCLLCISVWFGVLYMFFVKICSARQGSITVCMRAVNQTVLYHAS